MVAFKERADTWIKENFGIEVEHVCAMTTRERLAEKQQDPAEKTTPDEKTINCKTGGVTPKKLTFEDVFLSRRIRGQREGELIGWPRTIGAWCNSELKMKAVNRAMKNQKIPSGGGYLPESTPTRTCSTASM